MSQWPGGDRRDPSATDRHYLALRPLSTALQGEVAKYLTGSSGLDVLDIGCGVKPYQPFFAPYAATHRGLDAVPGPYVDDVGHAEALPYEVVTSLDVLEHVAPDRRENHLREALRVAAACWSPAARWARRSTSRMSAPPRPGTSA